MNNSGSQALRRNRGELVDFMSRFASSEQFEQVFQEGMGLVEETANYLDGPGRQDARALDRKGSIAYATESMRLTTRLMQLASWLLLQRAISGGELSEDAARIERGRISLDDIGAGAPLAGQDQLPHGLNSLVSRSLRLRDRIAQLNRMIEEGTSGTKEQAENPVNMQVAELAARLNLGLGSAKG